MAHVKFALTRYPLERSNRATEPTNERRNNMKKYILALVAAVSLSACSLSPDVNSAERPTVEEISAALASVDEADGDTLTAESEACMAQLLFDSEMSNNYLRETTDNPEREFVIGNFAEEDEQIFEDLLSSDAFYDCAFLSF